MYYVGKAVKEMAVNVSCLGIAPLKMVTSNELLERANSLTTVDYGGYDYDKNPHPKRCALNPNHSHFILMDSPMEDWREEIRYATHVRASCDFHC